MSLHRLPRAHLSRLHRPPDLTLYFLAYASIPEEVKIPVGPEAHVSQLNYSRHFTGSDVALITCVRGISVNYGRLAPPAIHGLHHDGDVMTKGLKLCALVLPALFRTPPLSPATSFLPTSFVLQFHPLISHREYPSLRPPK